MILRDLYNYAEKHGLGRTYLDSLDVGYQLMLDQKGNVRLEKDGATYQAPAAIERQGSTPPPNSLWDLEPSYTIGTPNKGASDFDRFAAFWEHAASVLERAGDTNALRAVRKAWDNRHVWGPTIRAEFEADQAKDKKFSKVIGLAYAGDLLWRRTLVRQYFEAEYEGKMQGEGDSGPKGTFLPYETSCLITGETCRPVRLHGRIKGIPGASKGFPLVSYNITTFEYKGLKQGANFPVSFKAMRFYTSALNDIVRKSLVSLGDKSNFSLVIWGDNDLESPIVRVLTKYPVEDREQAWEDVKSLTSHMGNVHMAMFKGSQGRISLLRYDVVPVGQVAKALVAFYDAFKDPDSTKSVSVGNAIESLGKGIIFPKVMVEALWDILSGRRPTSQFMRYVFRAPHRMILRERDRQERKKVAARLQPLQATWMRYYQGFNNG